MVEPHAPMRRDHPPRRASAMRFLLFTLFACAVSSGHAQQATTTSAPTAPAIPEQNGVLVLTERTFATAAGAFDPLFVLFDSSTRYGSLTLRRRFADAAQAVRVFDWNATAAVQFASIDVSQLTRTLPYELKVLGLPALLLFHCLPAWPVAKDPSTINVTLSNCAATQGGVEIYTGGRTSMEFQRFALGHPLREAIQFASKSELDAIVNARPFVALFIVDGDDSQAFIDCRVLAQVDADTSAYVVTTNESILTAYGEEATMEIPSLVLFRQFGHKRVVYKDDWNKAALLQFIQRNRYNLVSTYTASDAGYFYDRTAIGHVLLFSDLREPYHTKLLDEVQGVAFRYYVAGNNPGGHVLRFLVVPKHETTLKNALFVLDDQFPTVLVVRDVSQAPLRMPFVGDATLELIQSDDIAQAMSEEIEKVFPPFTTVDLPDDAEDVSEEFIDWRDYTDLFTNRRVPFVMRVATPVSGDSVASTNAFQGNDEPSAEDPFVVLEVDLDSPPPTSPDPFLSIVTLQQRSSSTARAADVLDLAQLQSLLVRQGISRRVLVALHSLRCYSCRQAMDALDALPTTSGVDAIAVVDVDRVDVREWPLHFQWLPGIFLFEGPNQSAMFPGRTAVTVDALVAFLTRAANAIDTSQIW